MSEKITWADPPPAGSQGGNPSVWRDRLRELCKRPGEWGVWRLNARGTASHYAYKIVRGTFANQPPGKWEATTRVVPGSPAVDLYVRYLGEEQRCDYCNGEGAIAVMQPSPEMPEEYIVCGNCKGTGLEAQ